MIRKFGLPEWKVHDMANCRKGIWRSTMMLNSVLTNKIIASFGYLTMTDYYLKVCENKLKNRHVPNGMHGGVRGR